MSDSDRVSFDKLVCQYCGAKHDSAKEHTEHVERMHYGKVLREAESE